MNGSVCRSLALGALTLFTLNACAERFRVVTYNVENYLDQPTEMRREVKSEEAKRQVRASLLALKPDVLALEEMGQLSALKELQASLKAEGLDLPHLEFVQGWDTNVHVCVLSKFPIVARRSHTNETFLLSGRRFHVSRGFSEVDIQVTPAYQFTLLGAHLKSRRAVPDADEAEMRLEEARILRAKVDSLLAANPNVNLLVCGDLNDNYDAPSVKAVVASGKHKLVDTRPAERNGDNQANPSNPRWFARNVAWTHYYGKEDVFSRLDYILLSAGMAKKWVPQESFILHVPNWGMASDHRPIMVTIDTDRH
jgi:endonuclease/exonuclease/phosphatase family metal-dependent hydrolase